MLEGPAEQKILRAGQWLADQFAYRRINKRFSAYTRSYLRHNDVDGVDMWRATLRAAREALVVRRRPRSFPTLRFYSIVLGELSSEIVDEIEYWRHLHRDWGGAARGASDAKTLTRKLTDCNRIPDIGYFVNGGWFDSEWRPSTPRNLARALQKSDQIVIKADFSERGNAVRVVTQQQLIDPGLVMSENSVLQRKIVQHSLFSELMPGKEATVRLVTAFWAGTASPKLLSGLVKWDVLGSDHVSRLKINVELGALEPPLIRTDWMPLHLPQHRTARVPLELPGFQEARELVLGLHSKFPHYQLIGWDLGIDESGEPWIFEWNADHPAIFTAQAMNGAILAGGRASKGKTSR